MLCIIRSYYSIYGKGISHTREIIWPNVAKYFEGVTTVFLCKVFFYLVKESTTKIGTKDFPCKFTNIKKSCTVTP